MSSWRNEEAESYRVSQCYIRDWVQGGLIAKVAYKYLLYRGNYSNGYVWCSKTLQNLKNTLRLWCENDPDPEKLFNYPSVSLILILLVVYGPFQFKHLSRPSSLSAKVTPTQSSVLKIFPSLLLFLLEHQVWPKRRNKTMTTGTTSLTKYKWLFIYKAKPNSIKQWFFFFLFWSTWHLKSRFSWIFPCSTGALGIVNKQSWW